MITRIGLRLTVAYTYLKNTYTIFLFMFFTTVKTSRRAHCVSKWYIIK